MVYARHPDVAIQLTLHLEGLPDTPCLSEVATIPATLSGVGLEVPTWRELMLGARAPPREPDDCELGSQRAGWQHEAASRVDRFRDDVLFTTLPSSTRALIRSLAGPISGMALSATPTSMLTRIESHLFRIVLCGVSVNLFLCLRAAAGVAVSSTSLAITEQLAQGLGFWGNVGSLLRVLWPVCVGRQEAECAPMSWSGTLTWDSLSWEMPAGWRSLLMVSHSSLAGSSQSTPHLWVHCMLMGARGRERPIKTAALVAARRRKERTHPELVRPGSRARLVVLAGEIGGRWFVETRTFLSQLAEARSREEILLMPASGGTHMAIPVGFHAHVPLRVLSHLHFWNSDVQMARMVRVPPLMKWTLSSGMLGSRELLRQCA